MAIVPGTAVERRGRATASLIAAAAGIMLNSAALWAAELLPLRTAQGGLLRLLGVLTGLRLPSGSLFQLGFHVAIGLVMGLVYGLVLEPLWPRRPLRLGLAYATAVWLANAVIVLPVLGEGFAGSRFLSLAGMTWFAAAHTVFFVVLAVTYARLTHDPSRWHAAA